MAILNRPSRFGGKVGLYERVGSMEFVPIAAGHVTAKHQKSVIDLLRERHAVSRGAAQPLPDLSSWQRRRVEHLVDRGVVRLAARDRYYIDVDALQEWHSRQWAVAFSFAVIAAGVVAAFALIA
jgi:hypothetical protein